MAAAVNGKGASFEVGAVKPLFQARTGARYEYAVSADGQRFLINTFQNKRRQRRSPLSSTGPPG